MKSTTLILAVLLLTTSAAATDLAYIDIYDVFAGWQNDTFSLDEVINYVGFVKEQCGQNSECYFSKFPYAQPNMEEFELRLQSTKDAFKYARTNNLDPESYTDTKINSLKEFYYVNKVGLWIHGLNYYVRGATMRLQLEISKDCI